MPLFEFQLVLVNVSSMTEDIADALYEAGCDDAMAFSSEGVAAVGFSREAANLEQALRPAIVAVERAGFTVARVQLLSTGDGGEPTSVLSPVS
jgi:hypothetical protein